MPDGEGGISLLEVDNSVPAHKNKKFMKAFSHMLLASRKHSNWNNDHELPMIREAARQKEVTCRELYNAFWEAYNDHYTPSSGIEWRHLWKHIEEARYGQDRQLYSWKEVLKTCDKEGISTDHFERIDDEAERLKKEFPQRDIESLKCWKRK